MRWFIDWFELTGTDNWLVRLPGMRVLHEWMYPFHPDYNGGDY